MSLSIDAYWAKRQDDVTAAINTLLDGSISPSNPDSQACSPIDNFYSYSPRDSIRSISRGFGQLVRRSSSFYSETSSSNSSSSSNGIQTPPLVSSTHRSSASTSSTSSTDSENDFVAPTFVRAQTYFLLEDLFNDIDNPKANPEDPGRFTLTFNPDSHHYERGGVSEENSYTDWQPLTVGKNVRADARTSGGAPREGRSSNKEDPRGATPVLLRQHQPRPPAPGALPGRRGAVMVQRRKPAPMKIDARYARTPATAARPPPVPPKVPLKGRSVQSQQSQQQQPWSRPVPRRKWSWEDGGEGI